MLYTRKEQLAIIEIECGEKRVSIEKLMSVIMEQPSNIIYCEMDGKCKGIISLGDICRAYGEGRDKVDINRHFISIHYGEYMKAKQIFKEKEQINALPVITEDNVLIGDYTRWDDLLVLEHLIDVDNGQCVESRKNEQHIILVHPGHKFNARKNVYDIFNEYLKMQNISVKCIEHSEVADYIEIADELLFVDENEIRACKTRLKVMSQGYSKKIKNLKTYKGIFHRDVNFNKEDCALYLKKLQSKGVKIWGLKFEESTYYKQLFKEIEEKFATAGESIGSKLPASMYKEFFDDLYDKEYAEAIMGMPIEYENNGGVLSLKDYKSQYYNVVNGERSTYDQPQNYTRSIYFFGQCYIYGYYVEDKNTIESFLQRRINRNGKQVRVVNCGCVEMNSGFRFLARIAATQLKKGDVIIIGTLPEDIEGVDYIDLSAILEKNKVGAEWLVDNVCHCNHKVNEMYANAIYEEMDSVLCEEIKGDRTLIEKDDNIIKSLYLDRYFADFNSSRYKNIGAVVINSNPFTYGHQYLIEEALKLVDFLIIFVVEQDKSIFSFAERFCIVKKGVENLRNIKVVPSGPFMASQMTIPEYFNKRQMTENVVEHNEQDAVVFSEKIALPLGIRYRFFGEEPLDVVTNQYNISMKKVLPKYDIEAVVIPRKTTKGKVISASMVRKCLEEKRFKELNSLLPETTKNMLGLELN